MTKSSVPTGASTSMPAAVYRRPGDLAVEDRPVPPVGAGDVLVEVSHCGICGSDLHLMLEGWGPRDTIQGHEWSGRIVAVGAAVDRWSVGQEVVGGPEPRCGACAACRAGRPSQCERRGEYSVDVAGGFARYVSVDQRALLAVPEGLSLRAAALAEPLAVSLHAITRSGIGPDDPALVFGAGPIGALVVAALRARGRGAITVVEPGSARRDLARRLGAETVIGPGELPTFTMAEPDRLADPAYPVVFECSGKRAAMESALGQLRRGGRLVLVGAGIEAPQFDPNRILLNELTITGSYIYDADGFEVALDLLSSGRLPVDVLVEPDDVPLDGLGPAMEALASGHTAGKVMVVPRTQEETP